MNDFGKRGRAQMSPQRSGRAFAVTWLGMTAVGMALGGCTQLDPDGSICSEYDDIVPCDSDSGGGSGGGSTNPPTLGPGWDCLQNPGQPYQPPMPPPATVNYIVPIVDFDNQGPVAGLQITLCDSSACSPSVPMPPPMPADAAGRAFVLQLPFGLPNGYLHIIGTDYAPMDYYFGGPIIGSAAPMFRGNAIPMLKQSTLDALLVDVMAPSPSGQGRGVLAVRTLNCNSERAAGVRVQAVDELDEAAVGWTLSDNNIARPGLLTDGRGVAGFANLPAGAFTVEGVPPGGNGLTYGQHTLRVKGGSVTLGEVRFEIGDFGR